MSVTTQCDKSISSKKIYKLINKSIYSIFNCIEQPYSLILAIMFFRENIVEYLIKNFDYNKIGVDISPHKCIVLINQFMHLKHSTIDILIVEYTLQIRRNKSSDIHFILPPFLNFKTLINEMAIKLNFHKTILLLIKNCLHTPITLNKKEVIIMFDTFFDLCYKNQQIGFAIKCLVLGAKHPYFFFNRIY